MIDAGRAAKIAMDRGVGGPLLAASSYFMKSPPVQYRDADAIEDLEVFIVDEDVANGDLPGFVVPLSSPVGERSR